MENNIENKYSFFAQYWNVESHKMIAKPNLYKVGRNGLFVGEFDYLVLKPLSSITDEDLRDIANIFFNYNSCAYSEYNDYLEDLLNEGKSILKSIDEGRMPCDLNRYSNFLDLMRSKGYALPWMGLSIEKQIEYGWIKLKSE